MKQFKNWSSAEKRTNEDLVSSWKHNLKYKETLHGTLYSLTDKMSSVPKLWQELLGNEWKNT